MRQPFMMLLSITPDVTLVLRVNEVVKSVQEYDVTTRTVKLLPGLSYLDIVFEAPYPHLISEVLHVGQLLPIPALSTCVRIDHIIDMLATGHTVGKYALPSMTVMSNVPYVKKPTNDNATHK